MLGGRLLGVGLVEEYLGAVAGMAGALAAGAPEELVLPGVQVVGFVDKGQDAGEHPDAVEGMALGGELWVGEGGVASQHAEARRHCKHERLEVGEVPVARAAYVGGREEGEDILGRLGQLPELRISISMLLLAEQPASLRLSSSRRRRGSAGAPPGGRCPA